MSGPAPREAWRRALHLLSGTLALAAFLPAAIVPWGFAALLAAALALEAARLAAPPGGPPLGPGVGAMFRPGEARGLSGASLLAVGYAAVFLAFPGSAAARAVLVTATADPAAAAAGTLLGRATGHKTWVGTGAAFSTAALVLLLTRVPAVPALAAAAAAAAAERLPWRGADNVAIPLATAAVLRLLG